MPERLLNSHKMKSIHLFTIATLAIHLTLGIGMAYAQIGAPWILGLPPPLQQVASGVKPHDVLCQPNYFVLVIKSEDGSPACVTIGTKQRLIEQGWAEKPQTGDVSKSSSYETVSVKTSENTYAPDHGISVLLSARVANPENVGRNLDLPQLEYPLIPEACGIPYYNLAIMPGDYKGEIRSFADLVRLKDKILNLEVTNKHTSCIMSGPQQFVSVKLSEPTKIPYEKEPLAQMREHGYDVGPLIDFVDKNPNALKTEYSNATVKFVTKSGSLSTITYNLLRFFGNVTQYYDKSETRDAVVSPTDGSVVGWDVYIASHQLESGNYTLVGFTMSGSISEPV
ncbi:MAG TPA: hypothetical protein VFM64_01295, partial [Candidatus Nitrosotenuis sp.]|nr:hypothetical protein [Candidatus Nitrosotenuis sp.]